MSVPHNDDFGWPTWAQVADDPATLGRLGGTSAAFAAVVVHLGAAPDITDVSSLGVRESD